MCRKSATRCGWVVCAWWCEVWRGGGGMEQGRGMRWWSVHRCRAHLGFTRACPSCTHSPHAPHTPPTLPTRATPHSTHSPTRAQVSLASDFMWNLNSREANASFGYDYALRQCRLRGRIDTGACRRCCCRCCWAAGLPLPLGCGGRRRRARQRCVWGGLAEAKCGGRGRQEVQGGRWQGALTLLGLPAPSLRRRLHRCRTDGWCLPAAACVPPACPPAEGKVAAFLEERLNVGVNFILSAEGEPPRPRT